MQINRPLSVIVTAITVTTISTGYFQRLYVPLVCCVYFCRTQSLNQVLCIPPYSYNHSLTPTFTKHNLFPILRVLTHAQFIERSNSSLLDKIFFLKNVLYFQLNTMLDLTVFRN